METGGERRLAHAGSIILHGAHKVGVYAALVLLYVSGLVWVLLHHFAMSAGLLGPEPHPLEYPSLQLHGVLAYVVVFLAGSLLHGHMRRAWHLGRNRRSGVLMLLALLLLSASGLTLYYFAGADLQGLVSVLHWVVGLLGLPLVIGHVLLGRRRRQRAD